MFHFTMKNGLDTDGIADPGNGGYTTPFKGYTTKSRQWKQSNCTLLLNVLF